jgi:hypothetical protein
LIRRLAIAVEFRVLTYNRFPDAFWNHMQP